MKSTNALRAIKLAIFFVVAVGIVSLIFLWARSVPTELPPAGSYPLKMAQMRDGIFWSSAGLRVVYVDAQHHDVNVKLPTEVPIIGGAEDQLVVANGQVTIVLKKDTAIDQSDLPGWFTNALGIVLILIVTFILFVIFGQEPKKEDVTPLPTPTRYKDW